MGKRRNSLIILVLVLALLGVSGYVIATKSTVLGLDLEGGTELVYQARPSPQVPDPGPEDVDRAIEIIRERVDALAARWSGPDPRRTAERLQRQAGDRSDRDHGATRPL
jgi:preprotein translocase subunit SecD